MHRRERGHRFAGVADRLHGHEHPVGRNQREHPAFGSETRHALTDDDVDDLRRGKRRGQRTSDQRHPPQMINDPAELLHHRLSLPLPPDGTRERKAMVPQHIPGLHTTNADYDSEWPWASNFPG